MTPMNYDTVLTHAVTEYDRKAAKRKGHNRHALGIYFARVAQVAADISAGADPRSAIVAGFSGRLADTCLKACGLPAGTREDEALRGLYYVPASEGRK